MCSMITMNAAPHKIINWMCGLCFCKLFNICVHGKVVHKFGNTLALKYASCAKADKEPASKTGISFMGQQCDSHE